MESLLVVGPDVANRLAAAERAAASTGLLVQCIDARCEPPPIIALRLNGLGLLVIDRRSRVADRPAILVAVRHVDLLSAARQRAVGRLAIHGPVVGVDVIVSASVAPEGLVRAFDRVEHVASPVPRR